MLQANLLGLPSHIRQQYKLLRPARMLDLVANTEVFSVMPNRFEEKKRERPRSPAQVNNVYEADEDADLPSETEHLN